MGGGMMRFSTGAARTAVLVAASGVAGCGGSSSGSSTAAPQPQKQAPGGATERPGGAAPGDALAATATGTAPHDAAVSTDRALPRMPSTVIKTGRLSIRLRQSDLGKACNRHNLDLARYGRFISSSTLSSGRHDSSTIVLRVP